MNDDVLARQWQQMRGELKSWWGKLADEDLDRLGGQKEKLVGLVQEAYGYTRDYAAKEVARRFKEFGDKNGAAVTHITANGHDLGATNAHDAAVIIGEKIANVIRENAPDAGAVVGAATANSYPREKKFHHPAIGVTALVRDYPVQSLLIMGVGLAFLLARRSR